MGQAEIVIAMEYSQLLPQPVFALAQRADPSPDRGDMLPDGEVDPLHAGRIDVPAMRRQHGIECFWKIMKSIFHMRSMQLQDDGLYTALLIKVFAYLLVLRLQAQGAFSKLTMTEIMRKLRREEDLREFLATHFHDPFSIT